MPFYADLHIHSKYSRACSRDCDLEHLAWWARRKGVTVVGSGDFTHPAWFEHLRENLEPAEPGLFRLREELDRGVERTLPASCRGPVRFMLSVEISTIYKRAERTRKVHHLVYVPDLEAAERFNRRLGASATSPRTDGPSSDWTRAICWRSRWRAGRAPIWCRPTRGRRGSRCSDRSPASTPSTTATWTWPTTSSRWRRGCPRTRR